MSDHADMPACFDKFEVRPSPVEGVGLFCLRSIRAGEVVALARLGDCRTVAGRRTNHSPMPNCAFEAVANGLAMVALRDIQEQDELTVDYRQVARVNGWSAQPIDAEVRTTARWRESLLPHRQLSSSPVLKKVTERAPAEYSPRPVSRT
ncbi:SET domain-containing protein-lysine N-methyltransferase [Hydrogenophaga crocea]|uniref:SET domain-containing protein n=1 Tax=Hydrogenophaga crocea TaxID=2716225 RepID=A0A6G8ICG3_9BURK|nr:SET domain-containing protein [Hydrogenophaga crocea]